MSEYHEFGVIVRRRTSAEVGRVCNVTDVAMPEPRGSLEGYAFAASLSMAG